MSDVEIGKKENERGDLIYFTEAYEWVTGEQLPELCASEHPDFICVRSDGQVVGVELVRVMRDPQEAFWDRILNREYSQEPQEALDKIYELVGKKGIWGDRVILVLQLMDYPLQTLRRYITCDLREDFSGYGFAEIWLADYTGIEAYGDIELFGLFPDKWWGYHRRPNPNRKPYG